MKYRVPLREDGLFFSLGPAKFIKPYVCYLSSSGAVRDALAGKRIWLVGASTYAREQLAPLFSQMAAYAESVTDTHISFSPEDEEELQSLVERLAAEPGKHVLFLAEDKYVKAFNQVCNQTPACLAVLTPVGVCSGVAWWLVAQGSAVFER